jgi:NTE family protein
MSESQGGQAQGSGPFSAEGTAQGVAEESGRALVLSGGGIKGAYQIGAIVEVIKRGFRPTAIYGISIGALNGGILASYVGEQIRAGQNPPNFLAAARRIEKYWHDNVTDFKKLGRKRNPIVLILEVLFGGFKGMVTMDGVIEMVRKEIRPENLKAAADAGLTFFAGTLNLTAGVYLDAEGIEKEIIEYIIASGMQPIVMPMHVIPPGSKPPILQRAREVLARGKPGYIDPGDSWIDGGLHNVAPLGPAIEKNYDKIICIVCRPDSLTRGSVQGKLTALGDRLSDVVAQRLLDNDLALALRINEWVEKIQSEGARSDVDEEFLRKFKKIDLKVIRPAEDLGVDMLTFNRGHIEMMIEKGHRDAAAEMQAPPRQRTPENKLGVRAPSSKPSPAEAAARWRAQ